MSYYINKDSFYNIRFVDDPNPNYERQKWDCLNENELLSQSIGINLDQLNKVKDLSSIISLLDKNENTLLIIGNGFDLSHGIPTKYTDFKKNFIDNEVKFGNKEIGKFKKFYNKEFFYEYGDKWADVESVLSKFSIIYPKVLMCNSSFDLKAHLRRIEFVYNKFPEYLKRWISEIDNTITESYDIKDDIKELVNLSSSVISFNYTNTISKLYRKSFENLCFIHGQSNKLNLQSEFFSEQRNRDLLTSCGISINIPDYEYLICGSCITSASFDVIKNKLYQTVSFLSQNDHDKSTILIDNFVNKFNEYKLINKNILIPSSSLKLVFKDKYKNVVVFGHSLASCDYARFDYFKDLLKDCKWYIGIYCDIYEKENNLGNNTDANNLKKFIRFMDINPINITIFSTK